MFLLSILPYFAFLCCSLSPCRQLIYAFNLFVCFPLVWGYLFQARLSELILDLLLICVVSSVLERDWIHDI